MFYVSVKSTSAPAALFAVKTMLTFFFLLYVVRLQFFRSVGYVSRDVLRSQVLEQWFSALCVWRRFRDHSKTADAHF